MDDRPIGIFDSGLGGLTTVKELRALLPGEEIIYFGDTGRVPYGTRSRATLLKYIRQDLHFLSRYNCKLILAACGTVSSAITPEIIQETGVPFGGVVQPAVAAACRATKTGHIGVIATSASIRSGAYEGATALVRPDVRVTGKDCPLFVPLVENGFIQPDNTVTQQVAQHYLSCLHGLDLDTLILGCTHFPLISPIIGDILGDGIKLIDAGRELALWAKNFLEHNGLLRGGAAGTAAYFVSDSTESFAATASLFLGESFTGEVTQVEVEA